MWGMTRAVAVLLAISVLAGPAAARPDEVQEANQALEQQDFARAAGILEKLLERDAENISLRFNLAFAYTHLGQDGKAIALYEKVIQQQPELIAARMNLGLLLLQNRRAADALPHLQAGAEARSGDFQTQLFYARALAQAGQPEESIAVYQKAAALDPKAPEAEVEPAEILAGLERFEEAAAAYQRAARIDPRLEQSVLQMAEQMETKGLREKALAIYRQYLSTHPESPATRERVGFLLMELQRYPEAIAELEKVVAQDGTAANRAALAQAYVLNDEPEKALPAWKEAVAADPTSPDLHVRYANALLFAQSFTEAAQHYLEAVKRNAALVEAWNGLAFSLYKAENYQGSLKALQESAARGTEKPANIFLRAIIEDRLQLYLEAKASYEKFLAQGSGLADEEWKSRERLKVINRLLEKKR